MQDKARSVESRAGRVIALAAGLVASAAVSACKSAPKELEPIAECVQVEQALDACTGHHQDIASQTAANPRDPAERERVRALCANDLVRIRQACR